MASLISIQINGQDKVADNLSRVEELIEKSLEKADAQRLIVLPECFSIFGVPGQDMLAAAELEGDGPIQSFLSDTAARYNCCIVAGTTPLIASKKMKKYAAASLVFDPQGQVISRYDKIHMFDVEVADKTRSYRESAFTQAGSTLALFDFEFGAETLEVAQTVCYDLRFPNMFSAYAQFTRHKQAPAIVVVPSAFTLATGQAHWHALLRARSIENQCFVVASNQVGKHADKRQTFGNSCIYSPWGECLDVVEATDNINEGFAIASFDPKILDSVRRKMPIQSHKKERYTL